MLMRLLLVLSLSLAAGLSPLSATAQDKAAEKDAKSPWALTGNLTFASEYRYRGIAQSNGKPALQGGFDLDRKSVV